MRFPTEHKQFEHVLDPKLTIKIRDWTKVLIQCSKPHYFHTTHKRLIKQHKNNYTSKSYYVEHEQSWLNTYISEYTKIHKHKDM